MKTRPLPVNGQILYDVNCGNASRFSKPEARKVIVRKVGRKYFECSPETAPYNTTKYHLEDWREASEYSPTHELYLSVQEWEDVKEKSSLSMELFREVYNGNLFSKLSLPQLKELKKLLQSFDGIVLIEQPNIQNG